MIQKNLAQTPDTVEMAADLVMAYVSNNRMPTAELPKLIGTVHAALSTIANTAGAAGASAPAEGGDLPTAAQIKKSVTRDGIVSFLDGKSYKTLRRHLTGRGLDPHSYRQRFGLPADYPMTAKAYSEARSKLARDIGLGRPGHFAA